MRPFFACLFISLSTMGTVAGEVLDCATNKHRYRPGEPVHLKCTNNGDAFVVTGISFKVTTPDGGLVYNPAVPAVAVAVPSRASTDHTWDQTFINSPLGDDGEQVPRGTFVATVKNGRPARFTIGDGSDHPEFETVSRGTDSGVMTGPGVAAQRK